MRFHSTCSVASPTSPAASPSYASARSGRSYGGKAFGRSERTAGSTAGRTKTVRTTMSSKRARWHGLIASARTRSMMLGTSRSRMPSSTFGCWTALRTSGCRSTCCGPDGTVAELRERLDEQALPALKKHILDGLKEAVRAGTARDEDVQPVRLAAKRGGGFLFTLGANRHQALLLALIETVTAAIGSRFIVAVRRLPEPILITGSEPVVLFANHRFERGRSCAQLLTDRQDPIRLWDDRTVVLKHVDEVLGKLAGLAVAIDPRTLLLMVDPDLAESTKLLWIADHVPPEALGGMVNVLVTAGSRWIAGHDGLDYMTLLASATDPPAPLNTREQHER